MTESETETRMIGNEIHFYYFHFDITDNHLFNSGDFVS